MCIDHGYVIATEAQLSFGQQHGYEKCRCGWLDGGDKKYPMVNPNDNCGNGAVGLIDCAWRTEADVFCYGQRS